MRSFRRISAAILVAGGGFALAPTAASANTICDLRAGVVTPCAIYGGVGTKDGLFLTDEQQPTGSGAIDSFLRIQQKGWEQGYNTSDRSYPNGPPTNKMQAIIQDKTDRTFTHDLLTSAVGTKTINGTLYAEFFLDVNEQGTNNANKSWITLDQLEIFTSDTASLNCYYNTATKDCDPTGNATAAPNTGGSSGQLFGATKVYDMDTGADNWVQLDYNLNRGGSGINDMVFYLPSSLLTGKYVYLFSEFGDIAGNDNKKYDSGAGFEEWWTKGSGGGVIVTQAVPEPSSMLLLGIGLLALGRYRRKPKSKPLP